MVRSIAKARVHAADASLCFGVACAASCSSLQRLQAIGRTSIARTKHRASFLGGKSSRRSWLERSLFWAKSDWMGYCGVCRTRWKRHWARRGLATSRSAGGNRRRSDGSLGWLRNTAHGRNLAAKHSGYKGVIGGRIFVKSCAWFGEHWQKMSFQPGAAQFAPLQTRSSVDATARQRSSLSREIAHHTTAVVADSTLTVEEVVGWAVSTTKIAGSRRLIAPLAPIELRS